MSVPNQIKSEESRKRETLMRNEGSSKRTGSARPKNNVQNKGLSHANQRKKYEKLANAVTDETNYQHILQKQWELAVREANNDDSDNKPSRRGDNFNEVSNVAILSVDEGDNIPLSSTSSSNALNSSNIQTFENAMRDESSLINLKNIEEDEILPAPLVTPNSENPESDDEFDGYDHLTDIVNEDIYHPRQSAGPLSSDDEGYLKMLEEFRYCYITPGRMESPDLWPRYSPQPPLTLQGRYQTDPALVSPRSPQPANSSWVSDYVFIPSVSEIRNFDNVGNPAAEAQSRLEQFHPNAFPWGQVQEELPSNVVTERHSDSAVERDIRSASSENGHVTNEPQVPEEEPNATATVESDIVGSFPICNMGAQVVDSTYCCCQLFCKDCIKKAIMVYNQQCPMCYLPLDGKCYYPIYF